MLSWPMSNRQPWKRRKEKRNQRKRKHLPVTATRARIANLHFTFESPLQFTNVLQQYTKTIAAAASL